VTALFFQPTTTTRALHDRKAPLEVIRSPVAAHGIVLDVVSILRLDDV
jgi:hypothetical protein